MYGSWLCCYWPVVLKVSLTWWPWVTMGQVLNHYRTKDVSGIWDHGSCCWCSGDVLNFYSCFVLSCSPTSFINHWFSPESLSDRWPYNNAPLRPFRTWQNGTAALWNPSFTMTCSVFSIAAHHTARHALVQSLPGLNFGPSCEHSVNQVLKKKSNF